MAPTCGLLLTPLLVDPGAWDPIVPLRWTATGALLLAGLLVVVTSRRPASRLEPRLAGAWLGALTIAGLAAAVSPVPIEAWLGEPTRRAGVLTVTLVLGAHLLGRAARLARGTVLRAAPVGVGLSTVAFAVHLVRSGPNEPFASLVGNAGQLGGYLVLLAGCSLVVARHDGVVAWRTVGWVATATAVPLTVATGSLAGVGALGVLVVGAWTVASRTRPPSSPDRSVTSRATAVGAALVALGALAWPLAARGPGVSLAGRIETWAVTLRAVGDRPWLGWGPDGLRHGFARHADPEFVARFGDDRITDRAHSALLEPLGAVGIVGAAVAVLLVAWLIRSTDTSDPTARGLVVTLAAGAVFLLTWFPGFELAVVLGVLTGLVGRPFRADAAAPVRSTPWRVGEVLADTALAVAVVGAVITVGVGGWTVVEDRGFVAARAEVIAGVAPVDTLAGHPGWQGVGHLLAIRPSFDVARDSGALRRLADQVEHPRDAERLLVAADARAAAAALDADAATLVAAIEGYERVLTLAPHHSTAWLQLGRAQLRREDPRAVGSLRTAADLRPRDLAPRFDLASFHGLLGETSEAQGWILEACALDGTDRQVQALAAQLGVPPAACRDAGR